MPESKRPLKVFLCHASTDKPKVRELYRYLKKRGIQPWFDEEDLVGGQDWQVEIPKALATSDAIIICLTKNSVDKEGYIQKEIKFALDKALEMPEGRIFLIPVKFEECEVPFTLSRYQWVDLTIESGYAKMMKALKFRASQLERSTVEVSKKDVEDESIVREKKEHEAAERAEREKREKELREKQGGDFKEKIPHKVEKKGEKPVPVKPKAGVQIAYWFAGFVVLILGVVVLFFLMNANSESPNSLETSVPSSTSSSTNLRTFTPTENIITTPLIETPTPLSATDSENIESGMLVYKSKGENGLPDMFISDLITGKKTKLTDNQGFTIYNEKISGDKKFLAFNFGYGSRELKLAVINLDSKDVYILSNELMISRSYYYDWLPDNKLIFNNIDSNNIELYDPLNQTVSILNSGSWYSLSPDESKIVIGDNQSKKLFVGDLGSLIFKSFSIDARYSGIIFWSPNSDRFIVNNYYDDSAKLFVYSDSQMVDLEKIGEVHWSPGGEKIAIITYTDKKPSLKFWLKDGIEDDSVALENANSIDFAWGNSVANYAYVTHKTGGENIFHVNKQEKSIGSTVDLSYAGLRVLPNGNYIYRDLAYSQDIIINTQTLEVTTLPNRRYDLLEINADFVVLNSFPYDYFILVDKGGNYDLTFSKTSVNSWVKITVNDDFWLFSNNEAFNPVLNEQKRFDIPQDSTVISWVPEGYYQNFLLSQEYSTPLTQPILVCIWEPKNYGEIISRQCTCGEAVCNCQDGTKNRNGSIHFSSYYQKNRNGIEQYFSNLGGSCTGG